MIKHLGINDLFLLLLIDLLKNQTIEYLSQVPQRDNSVGVSRPHEWYKYYVCFFALTSVAYFYAGLSKKGLSYFEKYIKPTPILLPINILEDFTKPLSLSFRLFGNIYLLCY